MKMALPAVLLGIWLSSCVQPPTPQEELELEKGLRQFGYRFVKVINGNTIVIDLNDQGVNKEVHLIGVDSPRYTKKIKEGGGHDAGNYLNELLARKGQTAAGTGQGKAIYVRLGFEGWRHGPLIDAKTLRPVKNAEIFPAGAVLNHRDQIEAYIYLEGRLINRLMIDSGYARVDTKADFSRKEEFLQAERRARDLKLGLWNWSLVE